MTVIAVPQTEDHRPDLAPHRVEIMAILNVTPDSFSDGGRFTASRHWAAQASDALLLAASEALEAGASILDIGGESTRPGSSPVPAEEEKARVIPAIQLLKSYFPQATLSVDTRKATVAEAAVEAGAGLINDVSGLQYDNRMAQVAARSGTMLVLTHSQGTPDVMQLRPDYPEGVVETISRFFDRQIEYALSLGVRQEQLILDPGFGFGKTREHNLDLLARLGTFRRYGLPLLAGVSRKGFLAHQAGKAPLATDGREPVTAAAGAIAVLNGATHIRVHDVKTQAPTIRFAQAVARAGRLS